MRRARGRISRRSSWARTITAPKLRARDPGLRPEDVLISLVEVKPEN
ncbi:hypothetical protein Mnod_3610 [Methylobacterium nodulans ORS 2060]|uniref:Uncharacterized protein n=1 Tax=Methylobacterium nodulans (strain LMG 21967 / CNCM I-2342 / ORS 2060) TaxID=460265 RepID=B8IQ19_METNO|nr:hypothetical protein Mnod_3610 [Methylobacterium nodulans ORS 2060]